MPHEIIGNEQLTELKQLLTGSRYVRPLQKGSGFQEKELERAIGSVVRMAADVNPL
jgi:hypothetical protein